MVQLGRPEDYDPDGPTSLKQVSGSTNRQFSSVLLNAVASTLWCPSTMTAEDRTQRQVAAFNALMAFKPTNEVEGMLAGQAVAMHHASMECFRRAMLPDQSFEVASKLRKDGANVARGMVEMLDALDRKRGKSTRQVVRVERVMVAPGGQAVVGTVSTEQAGGGFDSKPTGRPHAPPAGLAHDTAIGSVIPPLRGRDAERLPLPVACNAER